MRIGNAGQSPDSTQPDALMAKWSSRPTPSPGDPNG